MEIINNFLKLKKNIHLVSKLGRNDLRYKDDNDTYDIYNSIFGKKGFIKVIKKSLGNKEYVLIPNLFPYSKITQEIPHLVHYVLWSRIELTDIKIKKILENKFPNKKYVYIERRNKSIPEIKHWQVFILKI